MAERIRVQKAIAHAGLMSRRAAETAMIQGRVAVDGKVVVLGDRVDIESEVLTIDGSPVPINPEQVTYLLYKPVGVISTADDPQGRKTVVDLVDSEVRVYPVGRLDADSEGLILLTNDGNLADLVTHPKYEVHKKYLVEVVGTPRRSEVQALERGVQLDDGPAQALKARLVASHDERSHIEVTMGEGRKRQVRRMLDAIGYPAVGLVRTAIGPITDSSLRPGQSRKLSNKEVAALLARAKQPS